MAVAGADWRADTYGCGRAAERGRHINYCCSEHKIDFLNIKAETSKDAVLTKICEYVENGWPNSIKDPNIKSFFQKRYELVISDGCLFWNHRIVIPTSLREEMVSNLHFTHLGIVKMKSLARSYFWWPNLDKDIECFIKKCTSCCELGNNPPRASLSPWQWPNEPWERLHVDYLGPLQGKHYLIVLDAHTKWVEVFELSTPSSNLTIKVLRTLFARFGLPKTIVSDNGRCWPNCIVLEAAFKSNKKTLV
ncbi:Integrase zinc binding domain [Popillia japonica]|uniref:RNA-directed DNA polymerase n=1 Tax=Popillia japonica TaxID=7064 RepID=A0AAW1JTD4_POPJA